MFRQLFLWSIFAGCLLILLAAVGWMSLVAVRLDRAERQSRRQALIEEQVRLALWRMDSSLAPLLLQESARLLAAYQAFLPADGAGRSSAKGAPNGRLWTPSPLLTSPTPQVVLYFEIGPEGRFTSPQAPPERFAGLVRRARVDPRRIGQAAELLKQWSATVDRKALLASLPRQPAAVEPVPLFNSTAAQSVAAPAGRADPQQCSRDTADFNLRNETFQSLSRNTMSQQQLVRGQGPNGLEARPGISLAATGAPMTPLWVGSRLVLARRVPLTEPVPPGPEPVSAGREVVQGCLLDWSSLKASLLATIADLLPRADLLPASAGAGGNDSRRLAALPVELVPGDVVAASDGAGSPIMFSLGIAWACVLTAAAAVAALVWGVLRLSRRQAAFVSAVTHELRTPLTTFRLYAEMLAEGMVPGAEQRREYLLALRREADRLAHLVENVLSYARLERGRRGGAVGPIALGELVACAEQRLAAHAEQAGMTLVVEGREAAAGALVLANPSAVEQVLLNLVDNACKYAGSATDRRIQVELRSGAGAAAIAVRDHGPGISATVRRRLFRSFSKSARDAAETAPGIGLGLTLSRRLARDMGGDLRLDATVSDGACFVFEFK